MIKDELGRTFEKLRISLNEHCNFSCSYCVDPTGEKRGWNDIMPGNLVTSDYIKIVNRLQEYVPVKYIRLTGGEPLLYKELDVLIKGLKKEGIVGVSLTTNGFLLEQQADRLRDAGLDSLNISLDAVEQDTFKKMSGDKGLERVLKGIEKAVLAGFPIKLNSVIMKGTNDHQVLPLFEFGKSMKILVRYIELMKMGWVSDGFEDFFYSTDEILAEIGSKYRFKELKREKSSTANIWETEDGYRFGIIANESKPFCHDCNRLRIDSFGRIFGCLSTPLGYHLQSVIDDELKVGEILRKALAQKQKKEFKGSKLSMLKIGG